MIYVTKRDVLCLFSYVIYYDIAKMPRKLMISCADGGRALNICPAAVSRAAGRGQNFRILFVSLLMSDKGKIKKWMTMRLTSHESVSMEI